MKKETKEGKQFPCYMEDCGKHRCNDWCGNSNYCNKTPHVNQPTKELLSAGEYFESGTDIQKRQWKTMPMYFAESYAQYREQLYLKSKLNEVKDEVLNSIGGFSRPKTKRLMKQGARALLHHLKKN